MFFLFVCLFLFFFSLSTTWCIVMYKFSILNCFIFSFWRAVFIWEFSFPLLLSFTYCTFIYVYIFLFCTLVKRIIKLKLKLKIQSVQFLSLNIAWRLITLSFATCNAECKWSHATLIQAPHLNVPLTVRRNRHFVRCWW